MIHAFDPGPPAAYAAHFAALPDYSAIKEDFWFDWGPVFYRGRLDGSAKIICVASDPGPTERIAGRTLVGNAGQRVQGFLKKIGITTSYVCVNGFAYSLFPGKLSKGIAALDLPEQTAWRNKLFDQLKNNHTQAIIAFGAVAQKAVNLWPGKAGLLIEQTYHPSYHTTKPGSEKVMLTDWNRVVNALRPVVTVDAGLNQEAPLYGDTFSESDYAPIPKCDLPFGVPPWFGDDAWFRSHRMTNCVNRPSPDDHHTLQWKAPKINP